jgi:hypothetical protein
MIFFDDRKNKKCVQVSESSRFVWDFEVEQPYFWKRCRLYGPKVPIVCQYIQSESETASKSTFSQM